MSASTSPTCSDSPSSAPANRTGGNSEILVADIPIEIVSEEEMAFIEAALSAATSSFGLATRSWGPLSPCRRFATSFPPSPARRIVRTPPRSPRDIEDSAGPALKRSLLRDFRSGRGLTVTDITATEWCEKRMEFVVLRGKPGRTKAMIAGSNRHAQLEEEVVEKIEIQTNSVEDSWAVKFLNFIAGVNQLLFEGLTRELPVIGFVEGIWLKGVIDEVQMPTREVLTNPLLVDTKTRVKLTLPSEAQKRNSRLQLMCYKYLWDTLVLNSFPKEQFFKYFCLNPDCILSEDVNKYIVSLGLPAKTLEDVVTYFKDTCCVLSPAQEQLLLRYELQSDHSLLEEYQFEYEEDWLKARIRECIMFWSGEREANYVEDSENWKCRYCSFTEMCPKQSSQT
ncbi:Exonuclease V, chloroplastic [Apostasia shenzhenica]|uniref:Exonuclease V, chloroplastic n=1 Tax=Apostasia shenzhenica TaxID=1088818 RepID=A0A2I0BGM8_9ASPA|nr:Exonuclease V, chloroplastic [Apostasia shenzhenica]